MRKLIALLCLITALVVALGPPGWATTVLPLNVIDTPAVTVNALPVSIVATPTVNQPKPTSETTTTTTVAYEKPGFSVAELLFLDFYGEQYTYCWVNEANANGYYLQEGEYPLTDSTTTSMI